MRKVSALKVVRTLEATESALPAQIQEALGELVGAAREGLLALSVGVGLGVVRELMEFEVTEVPTPDPVQTPLCCGRRTTRAARRSQSAAGRIRGSRRRNAESAA